MRIFPLLAIWLLPFAAPAEDPGPSSPVVTVNGETITRGDIGMRVLARLIEEGKPVDSASREGEVEKLAPGVTTELIVEKILDQAAREQGFEARDDEVEAGVMAFKKSVPEKVSYSDYLLSYGTTDPIVRSDIARNIRVRKLVDKVTSAISEPEEPVLQAAYAKNRDKLRDDVVQARHIVVATRAEAEVARKRVTGEAPEPFGAVAKEVSTGSTAERGGAVAEFPRGFLDPVFEEAAFALEPGEVSEVVETSAGFHVIKLEAKRENVPLTYETARERIREQIHGRKHNALVYRLIHELRSAAELEWASGVEPPGSATGGTGG